MAVYDNVEDADIFDYFWPDTPRGDHIVTSRDEMVTFESGTAKYNIQTFDNDLGASALLSLLGRSNATDVEKQAAVQLVDTLGGLPLAITHVSGFVAQQRLSLSSFLSFYEKNAAKIDQRKLPHRANEHTLSTVWEIALDDLPPSSKELQDLLALFDPDEVSESVLIDSAHNINHDGMKFLEDDME